MRLLNSSCMTSLCFKHMRNFVGQCRPICMRAICELGYIVFASYHNNISYHIILWHIAWYHKNIPYQTISYHDIVLSVKPLSSRNGSNNLSSPLCMLVSCITSYHHCSSISSFISYCHARIMYHVICTCDLLMYCNQKHLTCALFALTWGMELMLTALVWPSSIWTHAIQKDSGQNCYDFRWFFYERFTIPQCWWLPKGKERIVEMYEIYRTSPYDGFHVCFFVHGSTIGVN